jgi:hypothetical protein
MFPAVSDRFADVMEPSGLLAAQISRSPALTGWLRVAVMTVTLPVAWATAESSWVNNGAGEGATVNHIEADEPMAPLPLPYQVSAASSLAQSVTYTDKPVPFGPLNWDPITSTGGVVSV